MKKIGIYLMKYLAAFVLMWMPIIHAEAAPQTIYNSPYVTFSPDGKAWTTDAGDRDYTRYDIETSVGSGIVSSIRSLEPGEHYYKVPRKGTIPIGYWKVAYTTPSCIHNDYPKSDWHGISFGRNRCGKFYYSGWQAYCADCGGLVDQRLFYMSKEAAASIDYLDVGEGMDYYYLCPHCDNLEQGSGLREHACNAISWNCYGVQYDANTGGAEFGGYMANSTHMYNNATEYEGKSVTPVKKLTRNSYTRIGYEFVEWNTRPDGSGRSFEDGAEIYNLTDKDMNADGEDGIVILYAQWRYSSNTLRIDPNGGSYHNNIGVTELTRDYGTVYTLQEDSIQAPAGYTVSFETNGGNAVAPITGTMHFVEWTKERPFLGKLINNRYYFMAPDGNTDTITARYAYDVITLPGATRQNMSFGGWYYDEEFKQLAGEEGDTLIPDKDLTLYAQWVDLRLTAENNYSANGRKGAVDLAWNQEDQNQKTYMIYQSRTGENWVQINAADDISNSKSVEKAFSFSGSERYYTIPYTGLYTLYAEGAQGGNYGSYVGGKGGSVSAKYWLQKGEIITYIIGGQNGYNSGGTANMYAGGGGATIISTNQKGIIMVAGGGGGASALGNGGAGGSSESVLNTGLNGESGGAGGGGGYRGGSAGKAVYHHHIPLKEGETENDCYIRVEGYNLADRTFYQEAYANRMYGVQEGIMSIGGHSSEDGNSTYIQLGRKEELLSTEGAESVTIGLYAFGWGELSETVAYENMTLTVYDQSGAVLYSRQGFSGRADVGEYVIESYCTDEVTILLPAQTQGIYIVSTLQWDAHYAWLEHRIEKVKFGSAVKKKCIYDEGELVEYYPAYGGTNYVNTSYSKNYVENQGVRTGNGTFSLRSDKIGFMESVELKGVVATDEAAPDKISLGTVKKEDAGSGRVRISWGAPEDNGTDYYHMVESYLSGLSVPLCQSNITRNHLVSGVRGYYYLLDANSASKVNADLGSYFSGTTAGGKIVVGLSDKAQYLHVAAVDIAGNIGATEHIRIGTMDEETEVQWKLHTKQLILEEGDNVYPANRDKTYFVQSDGITPFTLQYQGYMDGPARLNYQPNHIIYESEVDNEVSQNIFSVDSQVISDAEIPIDAGNVAYATQGRPLLGRGNYAAITRQNKNRQLAAVQNFVLPSEASGKEIVLTPIAGADYLGEVVYSDSAEDAEHALILIADGEAPVIEGLEVLQNRELINRADGTLTLQIFAQDELCGVKDFYVEIYNSDNVSRKVFAPDEHGMIRVDITGDEPVFSGNFTVTAYAVDNVGNERTEKYSTTEFALEAKVKRILSPHTPVFQRGESGLLTVTTWGYADYVEVEFPAEMTALNESLNQTFIYTDTPRYKQEDTIQFMIPLDIPADAEYVITVRAYKGDTMLAEYPCISTISVQGSILDDIRTRLR